ncbi:MAG: hypothetical protein KatS3mg102_1300 [Planctomycetota bacterium]|nr:MAG: hypothetical protein KatS3mg102_1300 [Planctomycetota bacterium]
MSILEFADPRKPLHDSLELRGPGGPAAVRELARTLGLTAGSRVLELGCGCGRTACQLAREFGCQVVATDLDPDCLEAALARVVRERLKGQVVVRQADMRALFAYFPLQRFEAVIAENSVVHLGIEVVAPSVLAVVEEEGYFAFTLPTWKRPPEEIPEPIRSFWEQSARAPMRTLEQNLAALAAQGFGRGFAYELDRQAWELYYAELRVRLAELEAAGIRTPEIEHARRELELWDRHDAFRAVGAFVYVGQPGERASKGLGALAAELARPGYAGVPGSAPAASLLVPS